MKKPAAIAIDLGAESCRVSLLRWVKDAPEIQLIHRFPNAPITEENKLCWDLQAILSGVETGLRACADFAGDEQIASIGVDGWAVDYVRLDFKGNAIGNPYCYRDERTIEAEKEVYKLISPDSLYALTGIQLLRINTLFQLYADGIPQSTPWVNLPEYVTQWLGGERVAEYTNATHTQLVASGQRSWCREVFEGAGLDLDAAPPIVATGTDVGSLRPDLAKLPSFRDARLIVPACHDTASAVAAIPLYGDDWAFISSGTWSLVGTVLGSPCATEEGRSKNFTNLGGVGGSICFLKNVNGMWLLRQCIECWRRDGYAWSIPELIHECEQLPAPDRPLDVDDPDLLLPGEMPARINAQRRRYGLTPIQEGGAGIPQMANAIFHGLAMRYAQVLGDIKSITGKKLRRVCIVGGGSRNTYLNRLTAERTGLDVIAGPAESSTIGNFAVQLAALSGDWVPIAGVSRNAVTAWSELLAKSMDPSRAELVTAVRQD